jgi:hypothetical protein
MEELRSSETSILTRTTGLNISEDDILHSHSCEDLKAYLTSLYFEYNFTTHVRNLSAELSFAPKMTAILASSKFVLVQKDSHFADYLASDSTFTEL